MSATDETGFGSVSQWYGSSVPDLDPYQNVTDPQHREYANLSISLILPISLGEALIVSFISVEHKISHTLYASVQHTDNLPPDSGRLPLPHLPEPSHVHHRRQVRGWVLPRGKFHFLFYQCRNQVGIEFSYRPASLCVAWLHNSRLSYWNRILAP